MAIVIDINNIDFRSVTVYDPRLGYKLKETIEHTSLEKVHL